MKFRKKAIIVDAEPYREGMEDGYAVYETEYPDEGYTFLTKEQYQKRTEVGEKYTILSPAMETRKGWQAILEGDWIVTGIEGERYPVRQSVFEETYEPLDLDALYGLPYSKTWYRQKIKDISGIQSLEVTSAGSGCVNLMLILNEEAHVDRIKEELVRRLEADKGLLFQCTAILLKPVSQVALHELNANT